MVSLSPYTEMSVGAVCPAPSFPRGAAPPPLCEAHGGLSLLTWVAQDPSEAHDHALLGLLSAAMDRYVQTDLCPLVPGV